MAYRVLVLEGHDIVAGDGLHQPAADVRWRGALPHSSPETGGRADPRRRAEEPRDRVNSDAEQVRILIDWRDPVRQTAHAGDRVERDRGPYMLYDTPEILAVRRAEAHEVWFDVVRSSLVQRVEGDCGRIACGPEIAEDREGRRPPGTGDGPGAGINDLVSIGCQASLARGAGAGAARRFERRKLEVSRCRAGGSRDGG